MINIKRILCPVDLSESSDKSLRYAAALARAYGAKLSVCHCVAELAAAGTPAHSQVNASLQETVGRARQTHAGATDLGAIE